MSIPTLEDVLQDIEKVLASQIDISYEDLTLGEYKKLGGRFDGRTLRKLGGFTKIIELMKNPKEIGDLATPRYVAHKSAYVHKLEKKIGDQEASQQEFLESFKKILEESPPTIISKLNKPKLPNRGPSERANCCFLSDTHFGLEVDKEEVLTNKYNWEIAAGRLGHLAEQLSEYKIQHRNECDTLHIFLGGDIIQGVIYCDSDAGTDLAVDQFNGAVRYLTQFIDYQRNFYDKIIVHGVAGNHERIVTKSKGAERTTANKHDNFSIMIYLALQAAFRNIPDVIINVYKAPIAIFDVLGHTYGLSHSDTHIFSGNVGSSININNITDQVLKLNQVQTLDALLLAHIHTPLYMSAIPSTHTSLIINGSLIGTDGYSSSKGYFLSSVEQTIWEVTRDVAVGDYRAIFLDQYEPHHLDIIKPYNYKY